MFAFLSLLWVRKGLMCSQSLSELSTSVGRKHGWVENQTFNELCRTGVGEIVHMLGVPKLGPW